VRVTAALTAGVLSHTKLADIPYPVLEGHLVASGQLVVERVESGLGGEEVRS
jgi:hypothetical protein